MKIFELFPKPWRIEAVGKSYVLVAANDELIYTNEWDERCPNLIFAMSMIQHMPGIDHLLGDAESFIAGFEGDETQEEPVDDLLERLRDTQKMFEDMFE